MEISGDVTDAGRTTNNNRTLKIELLSQWKLEAEFRNLSLRAISQYEGIRQWAEGKTFSGQVKVLTLFTSLKLGSNLDFHKITLPLLTPELNILSSMSAMHVSPQVSSLVFCDATREGEA